MDDADLGQLLHDLGQVMLGDLERGSDVLIRDTFPQAAGEDGGGMEGERGGFRDANEISHGRTSEGWQHEDWATRAASLLLNRKAAGTRISPEPRSCSANTDLPRMIGVRGPEDTGGAFQQVVISAKYAEHSWFFVTVANHWLLERYNADSVLVPGNFVKSD